MKKWLGVHLSMVFLIVILFSVSSGAGELPSYHKYQGPLKPGMEITKENFDRYLPELQKLLPPAKLQWYEIGLKKGVVTIPIAENVQYPLSRGQREATGKYGGTARVNADNQLVGWVAGVPFPKPKNALEIVWNGCPTISRGGNIDDTLLPAYFYLFQETKYEKHFQWEERNRRYRGRTDIPPLGDMPDFTEGNIIQKESFVIVDPHEVKGFIQLRIRYWDIDKPDDCYGYIPAIRRVRRLTGNDLTDPLLGSDCISDDFEAWRQKMNSKMEFRALECRDFLVPRVYIGANNKPPYHYQKHGPFFQVTWEIKPLWLIEVTMNDRDYIYSRRLFYMNATSLDEDGDYLIYWGESFDQKGRLWKANGFGAIYDDGRGYRHLFDWIFMNSLTNHYTVLDNIGPCYDPEEVFNKNFPLDEDRAFTIRGLLRRAR